jgi:hypothetical protein
MVAAFRERAFSSDTALDRTLQFGCSTLDGGLKRRRLLADCRGGMPVAMSLHHAVLVVGAAFQAILFFKVHLNAGNPFAGIAQCVLDNSSHMGTEPFGAFDVIIDPDIDFHAIPILCLSFVEVEASHWDNARRASQFAQRSLRKLLSVIEPCGVSSAIRNQSPRGS